MSYEEVERGLPSVEEVFSGTWRSPRDTPLAVIHPTWALISPEQSQNESSPSPQNISTKKNSISHPRAASAPSSTNEVSSESSDVCEISPDPTTIQSTESLKPPPPPKPPKTRRYIIKEEDNDMKVIQLDPFSSPSATLEIGSNKPSPKPKPRLVKQPNSCTLTIPTVQISRASDGSISPASENTKAITRRAKRTIITLLTCLPPLFLGIAIQFLKIHLSWIGFPILSIVLFQGILWSSLFFVIFNTILLNLQFRISIRNGWIELLFLSIFCSITLSLQLISLLKLDVMLAISLAFAPIIIANFILHIVKEGVFSVELLITSIFAYTGMTLIGISAIFLSDKKEQESFLVGFGASSLSTIFSVPSSILLWRIRSYCRVDDSITVTAIGFTGTIFSISIGLIFGMEFLMQEKREIDPGILSAIITFVFFGIIFQFIECKINHVRSNLGKVRSNQSKTIQGILRLSRTRILVFAFIGIWEICRLGIHPSQNYPSPFNIFGVIFLLIGWLTMFCYNYWLIKTKNEGETRWNKFLFVPWLLTSKRT